MRALSLAGAALPILATSVVIGGMFSSHAIGDASLKTALEAHHSIQSHLLPDEIVHRVVPEPAFGGRFRTEVDAVQVFLRQHDDERGGRLFRVWSQSDSLGIEANGAWVACDRADPTWQVWVKAPITTQLAHDIVEATVPQLGAGELISVISAFTKPARVDGEFVLQVIADTYEVTTQVPDSGGGRLFTAVDGPDSLVVGHSGVYQH